VTQYFTYRGFSLMKAPIHLKVLITAFVAMMALATAVGFVNYQVRTGLTVGGSRAWYLEGRAAGEPLVPGQSVPLEAKTPLELVGAAHIHLFNMAFLFFVLGHLLALCAIPPRWKIAIYLVGFASVLGDVASPWLIRFVAPSFAWLQLASHVAMAASLVALVILPLAEMWGSRARVATPLP
jgi:hypothetical protein